MENTADFVQASILQPVMALALWTLLVLMLVPIRRLKAIFSGELSPKDFKLGESDRVSDYVSLPNKNIINLTQMPILFYVVCILAFITQQAGTWFLALAWAYVVTRVLHSIVHITYNNVLHRFLVFACSNFLLVALWIMLLLAFR